MFRQRVGRQLIAKFLDRGRHDPFVASGPDRLTDSVGRRSLVW